MVCFCTDGILFGFVLGMDGLFSEFPDRSRESIDMMHNYTQWTTPSQLQQQPCPIDCTKY